MSKSEKKEGQKKFFKQFHTVAETYKTANNLNAEEIMICFFSLKKVYEDSKTDIDFITQRRLRNGASKCKMAGILLWRFSKTSVFRFTAPKACSKSEDFLYMNFHLGLMYVCKYVLEVDTEKLIKEFKDEFSEMKYLIENRHTNQEMIGLFFQLICHWEYCCLKKGDK